MIAVEDVPVVILCGGRGARLNERTMSVPKPLVEVGGRPVLWHVMKIFSAGGFRRFVLCLGYRGDQVRDYFVNLPWRSLDCTLRLRGADARVEYHQDGGEDWEVTFVDTGLGTETGERLRRVEDRIAAPRFFVAYADGVTDLKVSDLLAVHGRGGRLATMTCVRPRTHFGIVEVGADGAVSAYEEKPRLAPRVNGGFFCLEREVLARVREGEAFEREPVQRLVTERQLAAHVHDGFWACMDTHKDNLELDDLWTRGAAPWRSW